MYNRSEATGAVLLRFLVGIGIGVGAAGMLFFVVPTHVSASHNDDNDDLYGIDAYTEWLKRNSSSVRRNVSRLDDDVVERLPIPVLFGVALDDIVPDFGDPRGGGTRKHEGQDILVPEGTPIVSPTEAVVIKTGRGSSAGRYVYTANPGGETFVYMHLQRVADIDEGDRLRVGDVIGYVGDTGNAEGTPHLHWEIRDGGATDPYPRLRKEFDIDEKIEFLEDIFDDVRDEDEYAEFLVEEFAGTFLLAEAEDIELPREIERELEDKNLSGNLDDIKGRLSVGSNGDEVVTLQTFLIRANLGGAARRLAAAGATGYFGSITKAALIEYQEEIGDTPDGVFSPTATTRKLAVKSDGDNSSNSTASELSLSSIATLTPNDLSIGDRGLEVQLLQLFLIIKNEGPRARELLAASATGYFGPVTSAAFLEYQIANQIIPATGSYDAQTRAYILENE